MENILPLIKSRHSCVVFQQKPVEPEKIRRLLEAARWAPSAMNHQPWNFIVVQQPEILRKVTQTQHPTNFWVKTAPLIIAIVSAPTVDTILNGREYYLYDCGLAAMNLTLQAESENLTTHHLLAFAEDRLKQVLLLPQQLQIVILIAVGYENKSASLIDKVHKKLRELLIKSRSRKPLSQIAHLNYWGAPWKLD